MKKSKGMLLVALVALPLAGFAEDAVTNTTWKSSLALGATYKDGNTEKSLFTMNLQGDRFSPENDWINSLYGEYGKTEGDQTEGKLRGQSEYRHKFGGRNFFGGVFSEAYHDTIKQIRVRVKVGPNLGYYFINEETMKLDATAGINYVYERTALTEGDHVEARLAGNYLWDFSEIGTYYLNVEYSANVEDADDGNGLFITGVKSKLSDQLTIFIELRDEYDNLPDGADIDHNDVTIIAGLAYDF
ncbi:MAG: DUF481 domain-containing protein [Verrucomicrobia bacterium]|nr:DUF481 domain-containing protein [Verrucomicrobiota bacterium]